MLSNSSSGTRPESCLVPATARGTDRHERRIDDGQIAINRTNDRHQVKYVADATPVRQGDGQKFVDAATEQGTELLNASIIRPIAAADRDCALVQPATSPPSNRPGGWIEPRIG